MAATQTNISQTSIPDYAKKYIEDMLGKSWATTQVPYKAYPGERIAGLDPMTLRAMQQAGGMGTSKELDRAQGLMGTYAQQAAGTQYDPGNYGNQYRGIKDYDPTQMETFNRAQARQYMSPYQQEVTDVAKREAARQADMQRQVQAGQSTRAGAFGGARDALLQAEGNRNLSTLMNDIQVKGSQSAYDQAMQQFNTEQQREEQARQYGYGQMANEAALRAQYGLGANQLTEQSRQYGAGLGLQGLQAGMQGAQNLGAMGQTEFQQGMDINKLLAGYGTQRQQQQQNILQQQYQDFLNQRGYPQQQLSWFADMTRGLPLSQSTQQMYQAPPSALSQGTGLLTAGAGAYGMYNMANRPYAEGGKVDSAPAGLGALALSKMG